MWRALAQIDDMLLVALGATVPHPIGEARQILVVRIMDLVRKDTATHHRRHSPSALIGVREPGHHADPSVRLVRHVADHVAPLLWLLDHHINSTFSGSDDGSVESQEDIESGSFAKRGCSKRKVLVLLLQMVYIDENNAN